MKTTFNHLLKDPLYITGLILIFFSAIILECTYQIKPQQAFGSFFFNYLLSVCYLLYVVIHNFSKYRWRLGKGKIKYTVLLLILYFVSAFSLNVEMDVFDSQVLWLSVWLVLSSLVLIVVSNFEMFSKWLNYLLFFCLGMALVLFVYYAIYLIPLYLISVVGLVALGISIHTYIPIFLAIVTVVIMVRAIRLNKQLLYAVILGAAVPLIVTVLFLDGWYNTNKKIDSLINQNTLNESKLPAWIVVSQHLEPSFITERLLKSGLVYNEANVDNMFWGGLPSSSFEEQKKHDPLVVIATLLFKKPNLDETAKINILKSIYHARHQAQERLWAGDHLETVSVISNIKLFPAYRMAYTEKTLTIRNNSKSEWSNQEAIYTFHLTEGAVVSSLSLWIAGKEEKSRLTTKAKADSAYKTIVGIEQHDPSVVHWQEGNTISVRVFPCTPAENRIFKIGVTSPLLKKGKQLTYQQFFFDGPSAVNALESIQLTHEGEITGLKLPAGFKKMNAEIYRAEDTYQPKWQLTCDAPQLAAAVFSFANSCYKVSNYEKKYLPFTPAQIYLDLNGTWSEAEFDDVWLKVQKSEVYVYENKLIKLSVLNKNEIFNRMKLQNFSLFPIQKILAPAEALLISKNSENSPNLNDLDGSDFSTELTSYLKTPKKIRVFHLGALQSPYLKALKEFRVLNYEEGTTSDLGKLLNKHQFIQDQENEQTVVIDDAQLLIQKTIDVPAKNAPNHLLRLFAYNNLMKKVGPFFFTKDYVQPALIAAAEQAYIVSPVSSMIVLETQKDYDRFNIEANKDSLKNASMKSSGAVPEPHEWVLFTLCIGIAAYLLFKKNVNRPTVC